MCEGEDKAPSGPRKVQCAQSIERAEEEAREVDTQAFYDM